MLWIPDILCRLQTIKNELSINLLQNQNELGFCYKCHKTFHFSKITLNIWMQLFVKLEN